MMVFCVGAMSRALAEPVPAAVYQDPVRGATPAATMTVLHVPTHGVAINGIAYQPAGPGPFPVLVIFHGLPGNEKNLDLAQVVRRAGWIAVTVNYRGSWGSPGTFSFAGNLEDADAVLAYLRDPTVARRLRLDPTRIAIAGHSMGGWVVAETAAHDGHLLGAAMISAWDPGYTGEQPRARVVAHMADDLESLAGVTPEQMADELIAHARAFALVPLAPHLLDVPLLVLTSDDGGAGRTSLLVDAIHAAGGHKVRGHHEATDHGWSDRRIALQRI
jgi:dienelactone hydrolase